MFHKQQSTHLFGRLHVPPREGHLSRRTNSRGEDRVGRELNLNVLKLGSLLSRSRRGDSNRGLHGNGVGRARRKGEDRPKGSEHVLVRLVVTRAEDEVGIRVLVKERLDDLAFVDRKRSNLEVLLTDEN